MELALAEFKAMYYYVQCTTQCAISLYLLYTLLCISHLFGFMLIKSKINVYNSKNIFIKMKMSILKSRTLKKYQNNLKEEENQ